MSFALLAPLGLFALAALALPIVIHLVRRIELRTTDFAALRWISERIRPRRRIRFERPWLLLLRLLLLAAIALLLARPIVNEMANAHRAFVVVAPGVDPGTARAAVSLPDAEWHWLAPDFPPLATATVSADVPTASLLREIDARLPRNTTLAVVAPRDLGGLDGERPMLSRKVDWHVVEGRSPDSSAPKPSDTIEIAVRYAPTSEPALTYLHAAVDALNAQPGSRYRFDAKPEGEAPPSSTNALILLGTEPTPPIAAWIESGGTAIVDHPTASNGMPIWRDADGGVLARVDARGAGRLITLAGALSPQTFAPLLDADFPQRLRSLIEAPPPAPTRAFADALKPAQANVPSDAPALSASMLPLDAWLALLIAILFAVERVIATRARQSA